MKTEDFDDAIRRKMGSIESLHRQQEVDAIHRYVIKKKGSVLNSGYLIVSFILVTIIGILFTWNIFQMKEIDGLKQTIAELKTPEASRHLENKIEEGEKSGTISKPAGSSEKRLSFTDANNNDEEHLASSVKGNSPTIDKSTAARDGRALRRATDKIPEQGLSPLLTSGMQGASIDEVTEIEPPSATNTDTEVRKKTESLVDLKLSDAGIPASSGKMPDFIKPDSVEKTAKVIADSVLKEDENRELAYPKRWRYGAGISLEAGNRQLGFAILGQAVFKTKWAFSAGLRFLRNGEETFDDDDDFEHHKKNKFKNTYGNDVSEGVNKDIEIKNIIYQVPLNVSYIFLLKNRFSLLAGIGTDMDISVKQTVEYRQSSSSNELQGRKFIKNSQPVYLNNAVVTVGAQEAWKHFVFQLSPYVSPQLRQVDYKSKSLYYGLRLRTMFIF